jgi:hypothetical protein
MNTVQAAVIECSDCECSNMYDGPLAVGFTLCSECKHQLLRHVIRSHGVTAADPSTGRMPDDFEVCAPIQSELKVDHGEPPPNSTQKLTRPGFGPAAELPCAAQA